MLCFPLLKSLIFAIRSPFGLPFKVIRKGVQSNQKNYNLQHTWPLLILIVVMIAVLVLYLGGFHLGIWQAAASPQFMLAGFFLVYNLIVTIIAVLAAIDQPERRVSDRFPLHLHCSLKTHTILDNKHQIPTVSQACTENLSEGGALIKIKPEDFILDQLFWLELPEQEMLIKSQVSYYYKDKNYIFIGVKFIDLTLEQTRKLTDMLYCNLTWWKRSKKPGSLDVFLHLFLSFLTLRPLRTKYQETQ